MPIVHHTDAHFTGREVVAGVTLDFTNGSATTGEIDSAATAVITAVKHYSITGDTPTPAVPADEDIHADIEPEVEA